MEYMLSAHRDIPRRSCLFFFFFFLHAMSIVLCPPFCRFILPIVLLIVQSYALYHVVSNTSVKGVRCILFMYEYKLGRTYGITISINTIIFSRAKRHQCMLRLLLQSWHNKGLSLPQLPDLSLQQS